MVVHLTLLVHGSTSASRSVTFLADEPLDEPGRAQITALRSRLNVPSRVLCSPRRCAQETADLLGAKAGADPLLHDCGYGDWTGRRLDDIAVSTPDDLSRWMSDPAFSPPSGESVAQLCERVARWLDAQAAISGRCLAITHGAIVRAAIVAVLQAPLSAFWRIDAAPASLVRLSHDGRRWALQLPDMGGAA